MDQIKNKIKNTAVTIRSKRIHRNYTQEYLAYKLAISQNAYSKIELGYTKITLERLFQIAEILEFDIVDFINPSLSEIANSSTVALADTNIYPH